MGPSINCYCINVSVNNFKLNFAGSNDFLNVMYSNVDNGLLNKMSELQALIDDMRYDIMALIEVKAKNQQDFI